MCDDFVNASFHGGVLLRTAGNNQMLKQKVTAARAKQADPESLVVGLKIEKGCKIGFVTDVKQVLREASALKITYNSTDG